MPMTSPCELSSGPPELPGLMAASVWMAFSMSWPRGSWMDADGADDAGGHGSVEAEGIADGVDLLPTTRLREVCASVAGTRSGASICSRARSWLGSRAMTCAL